MVTYKNLGRYGRFGNQLFEIAGTIGIAKNHGYAFGFPYWKNYDALERFGTTEDIDVQKWFVNPLPVADLDLPDYHIPWGYHDVIIQDNTNIVGHMQSEKYFEHCIDLIRYYFTMKDEPPYNDYCAVHWRAGDYQDGGSNAYHPRQSPEYYRQAMRHFPDNQKYLVFSDDIEGAKVMFDGKDVTFANGNTYEDFRLMKMCKHFIIANSSYSLMAAILAEHPDKKIIAPALWFGKPARLETKDIYPKNTIII